MGKKRKQLDLIVTAIQQRWGTKALQRGSQALRPAVTLSPISTSFPQLDQALDGLAASSGPDHRASGSTNLWHDHFGPQNHHQGLPPVI
ncbi:MAG: hypothetical protein HS126_37590 [Anaerolineales bacterium]|nr:hypothetical protein [Anaerolineales bacterium]